MPIATAARMVAVTVTAATFAAGPLAVPAAAGLRITKIHFAGDGGSNEALNRERVIFRHSGDETKLKAFRVLDSDGARYRFPEWLTIAADNRLVLHSGRGDAWTELVCKDDDCWGVQHIYWGRSAAVWDDSGDIAKLKKRTTLKDRCAYSDGVASPKQC